MLRKLHNMNVRKISSFIMVLLSSFLGYSQHSQIDSLTGELKRHTKRDSLHANLLFDLGHAYHRSEPDKAMTYFEESEKLSDSLNYILGVAKNQYFKGVTLAIKTGSKTGSNYFEQSIASYEKIKYNNGIARSYEALGIFLFYNNDFIKSIENRLKAIKIKREIGDKKGVLNGLFFVAASYKKLGEYSQALSYYNKTIKLSEELNDEAIKADCLSDIGNIYRDQQNLPLALEYHYKSMAIGEKIGDVKIICDEMISIGNVYKHNENYDRAIEFYNKALIICKEKNYSENTSSILNNLGTTYYGKKDYKKALNFFEKSLDRFQDERNELNAALSYLNIGLLYLEQKNYNHALKYLEESKKIHLKINAKGGLASCFLGISQVYLHQKKYAEALTYVLKGSKIAKELKQPLEQKDAFKILSEIYEKTKNYQKALESHKQFKILNDSIFNKENIEKITRIEYEYKFKQARDSASIRELKLAKTVLATSKDLETSKRKYLWAVIGVLGMSLILGLIIFYQKFKNEKAKTEYALVEQKLLRSQMTPHFIFNSLSVLQGMILNKEESKSVRYLSKFSKLMRINLENSRDKLVMLSQELLAVENYLELQNLENASYQYTITIDKKIDVNSFQIPPMLIQPFVENAIEHAFTNQQPTKNIDIYLNYTNKNLVCTIADNGIGINPQKNNDKNFKISLSTTITTERLKMLSKDMKVKGWLTVENRQKYNSKGTLVTMVIPYKIIEA